MPFEQGHAGNAIRHARARTIRRARAKRDMRTLRSVSRTWSQSTAESMEAFFSQLQPPRIGFRDCSFFGRFRVVSYGSSIHFKIRTLAPRHSSPAPCTGCLVHASAMTMPEWRLEVVRDTHGQLRGRRPCSGKVPGPRRGGARAALLKQNFAY